MMTVHYFKFPDEDTAKVCFAKHVTEHGEWIGASVWHAIINVGAIWGVDGWHVNYIGDVPEACEPYRINPATPKVVIAQ
jgi:hypothetical protein